MKLNTIPTFALALSLAATAAGCGTPPYTKAASSYAAAAEESTKSIATAPASAAKLCRKKAQLTYLQQKLAAKPEITWVSFYSDPKTGPTDTQSWDAYCKDLDQSGKLFMVGVNAVARYGAALKALAESGKYDGSDLASLTASAAGIAESLGNSPAATAIKPVGAMIQTLAGFLLNAYVEGKIQGYVINADQVVKPLFATLGSYLAVMDTGFLKGVEKDEREALLAVELKSFPAGQPVDAVKLTQFFYPYAISVDEDLRQTRAVFEGYRGVITGMNSAHAELLKAGKAPGDPPDLKAVVGTISELLTQIQALKTALATKEK